MYPQGQIRDYAELYAKIFTLMKDEYLGEAFGFDCLSSATATVYIQLCKQPIQKIDTTQEGFKKVTDYMNPTKPVEPVKNVLIDDGKEKPDFDRINMSWNRCPTCKRPPITTVNKQSGKITQQCKECHLWLNGTGKTAPQTVEAK
jgi:hypothetical protein